MRSAAQPGIVVATALLAFVGAGCGSDDAVAELAEHSGDVRTQADDGATWEDAERGFAFEIGGAVDTGAGASARVKLLPAGGLRLGEHSRVRFGRGERRLDLEIGGAEIEATDEGFSVFTEFGEAEIEPDSRVALRLEDDDLRFEVLVGAATIEERGGGLRTLVEGDEVTLGRELEIEPPFDAGAARAAFDAGAEGAGAIEAAVEGEGVRMRGAGGAWARLEAGRQSVPAGARISLDSGSSIELARDDGRARIRGEAELVVGGEGEPIAVTSSGRARLDAGGSDLVLEVPGGAIIARGGAGGSRAGVDIDGSGDTDIEAGRGRVAVEAGDRRASLDAGERATLTHDGRIRVPRDLPPPPSVADFSIRAGESPTVHAPRPPVAIRIRYPGSCAQGGVVELARGRGFSELEMVSEGEEAAIVRAPRGTRHYRVRCFEDDEPAEVHTRGVLRVRRNPGTAPLPSRPPHTRLEADGRRYTVHYQNRLPQLTFTWPDAPTDDARLVVVSAGGDRRRVAAPGAERKVDSGALGDGEYRWWMEAAGDPSLRSPRTALVIAFDNAADSAHLREPGIGDAWDRGAVDVRGVTLRGWRVSVGDRRLPTDDQLRFSATVSLPPGQRALAIRFSHPEHGVHYYLRRARGG